MVANPANTNALILKENAPSIPAEDITCLTRLDHNRALGQVRPLATLKPAGRLYPSFTSLTSALQRDKNVTRIQTHVSEPGRPHACRLSSASLTFCGQLPGPEARPERVFCQAVRRNQLMAGL